MKTMNVPRLDSRYWLAILCASIVGTTLGDFVSTELNLGFIRGLFPLGIILAFVFLAERRARVGSEIYYWAAIVLTRTAATNLADLATHALKLEYLGVAVTLLALLAVVLLAGRSRPSALGVSSPGLPTTDRHYWMAILIASTLGTTMGDFVSDGLQLGVAAGSLLLGTLLCLVLLVQSKVRMANAFFGASLYWITIIIARTAGTCMGDALSGDGGLNLGHGWAAASAGLALVAVIVFCPGQTKQLAR